MAHRAACLQISENTSVPGVAAAIATLARQYGDLALVLLPEGLRLGEKLTWAGPEMTALADAAKAHDIYLAGALDLIDDDGQPARAGFVLTPEGTIGLRTAKLMPDLLRSGYEGGGKTDFPALDTPFGTVGMLIGEDILSHEYLRGVIYSGAEIVLNPAWERGDDRSEARRNSRLARAYENISYLLCATPPSSIVSGACAASVIFDYRGKVLADAGSGETAISATIDIAAARSRRSEGKMNFPAQLRTKLYEPEYRRMAALPKGKDADPTARANAFIAAMENAGTWTAPSAKPIKPYDALIVQAHITTVSDVSHREDVVQMNLKRSLAVAGKFAMAPNVKLVVFPEYWLTGAAFGKSVDDFWPNVGIRMDGREIATLKEFAAKSGTYVAGAIFEYDPDWPRRWFNTAFILDPRGNVILKYRKLQCGDINGLLNNTTPGNIYSAYVQRYGYDALFPVVDTEIGKLASCICYDNNFPELWRAFAMRGAEVIAYPTGEPHNAGRRGWATAKNAHAAENGFYIASANTGCEAASPDAPTTYFHRGFSRLIDYSGRIVAEVDTAGEVPLVARIDIEALRRARHDPAHNLLAHLDYKAAADIYAKHDGMPLDWNLSAPVETAAEGIKVVMETIERFKRDGIYKAA
ncbi:MAG: hypothetical protein KDE14_01080 [Rhodobacteraceae bacterium]|nr:hypothetical protein [Paracoccaceae bacterium]